MTWDRDGRRAVQQRIEWSQAALVRSWELAAMAERTLRATSGAQERRWLQQVEQQVLRAVVERALADSSVDA